MLLKSISGVRGRGQKGLSPEEIEDFETAVAELEAAKGIEGPTKSKELLGRWKLLYTSTPGTESPIQRTFTGIDSFQVFQDVVQDEKTLRVRNVIRFGREIGALRVEAEANTDEQPLAGFVPRSSPGLPIFGKSSTEPPDSKDKRIDFWFDRAAFKLGFLPFKVPYPVPFRLLGDETKGWIDVTYIDPEGKIRLSRGSKGTLFVLTKEERSKKQQLLDAIAEGGSKEEVTSLINEMKLLNPCSDPARSKSNIGMWREIWSEQVGCMGFGHIVKVKLQGIIQPASDIRTEVAPASLAFEIPGKKFPIDVDKSEKGYFDWWYLDENLRITFGSRGSTFVHLREDY